MQLLTPKLFSVVAGMLRSDLGGGSCKRKILYKRDLFSHGAEIAR